MSTVYDEIYWIPEHVRSYLTNLGYHLPLDAMEPHIRAWDDWMASRGDFYDYDDTDSFGRRYRVHRRSIKPAMRVCREWGTLLLNERTVVATEDQTCTDWLSDFYKRTGFMRSAQASTVKAFGLGTGAWALWLDMEKRAVRVRHYDARMVVPLTWDEDGVTECAFVTRAFYRGKAIDQLQLHLRGELCGDDDFWAVDDVCPTFPVVMPNGREGGNRAANAFSEERGNRAVNEVWEPNAAVNEVSESATYKIITVCFDEHGVEIEPEGVAKCFDTNMKIPTFALVKPAIANTRVDMSPYGQSVFADAVDAIQAVDLTFDALINEVDLAKMRVFLSDVMFDREKDGKRSVPIPFGKTDCTVFRKVASTDDIIQQFAPPLRTSEQTEAFRVALQMLGDLCGFGLTYFDFDATGYVKTATEVASDNSALLRNIRAHENALEQSLATISHAVLEAARRFGETLPDEGEVTVKFDDSIVQDVAAEKQQDMAEVGVVMQPWEYRAKWYGEDEATAQARARDLGPISTRDVRLNT